MAAAKKKAVKKAKRITKDDVITALRKIRALEIEIDKMEDKLEDEMEIVNTFLSYGKK